MRWRRPRKATPPFELGCTMEAAKIGVDFDDGYSKSSKAPLNEPRCPKSAVYQKMLNEFIAIEDYPALSEETKRHHSPLCVVCHQRQYENH